MLSEKSRWFLVATVAKYVEMERFLAERRADDGPCPTTNGPSSTGDFPATGKADKELI